MKSQDYLKLFMVLNFVISGYKCKKTFTYTISNQLEKPYFFETVEMDIVNKKPLIYYMEQAVLMYTDRFTSFKAIFEVYEPIFSGYFIIGINGREGFWFYNETNWRITNATGKIGIGVSHYIPSKADSVLCNFTVGA